jgi:hypothetical protein
MIIGTNKNELSKLVYLISGGGTFNVNQTLDNICAALHLQMSTCNFFIGQLQNLVGSNLTWPDISRYDHTSFRSEEMERTKVNTSE